MKELLEWRLLEERWNRTDSYAGKTESEWADEHKSRRRKEKTKRSMGLDGDESYPGEKELRYLSQGIVEKKKDEKPNCGKGQSAHGLDGRFVNPKDEKGSWSSGRWSDKNPKDCKKGVYRRPGASNEKRIVKKPCGRKSQSGGKSEFKCSTGEKVSDLWEQADEEGFIRVHRNELKSRILEEMRTVFQDLDESTGRAKTCITFNDFLIAVDNLNKSLKGELRT